MAKHKASTVQAVVRHAKHSAAPMDVLTRFVPVPNSSYAALMVSKPVEDVKPTIPSLSPSPTHPADAPWPSADGLRHDIVYATWRNKRRKAGRKHVTNMLKIIDSILPLSVQSNPSPNGAGGRAVGMTGRSLHDVLKDTVRYLTRIKKERLHKQHCVELARGLQSAESVSGMGLSAQSFFKASTLGVASGSSLANFVKCEDLGTFHNIICNAPGKSQTNTQHDPLVLMPQQSGSSVRLMHFNKVESSKSEAMFPQVRVSCLAAPSNPQSLPMAFSYDPLLDTPDTGVGPTSEASGAWDAYRRVGHNGEMGWETSTWMSMWSNQIP